MAPGHSAICIAKGLGRKRDRAKKGRGAGGYRLVERRGGWLCATGASEHSFYSTAHDAAQRCNGLLDRSRRSRAGWRSFYRIDAQLAAGEVR